MRRVYAIGLAVACMSVGQIQPVRAEMNCAADPSKLGVSRTVTIDATGGPRYGAQYRNPSFLKEGEVVITFDDGPSRAYTRPILDALAAHCTKATFFMVGRMAVADPAMAKEVAKQGHTVATHTWSHANLDQVGSRAAETEIEMGISAVRHALGQSVSPFFRFPYLRDSKATLNHLASRQVAIFSIDVDSKDYLTTSPANVVRRTLQELASRKKGIILLHDIHASTARAMPTLLAELKARGYRVVHIVPKAEVQTIAAFDAQAAQQGERRRVAADRAPLTRRSVTWPATILSQSEPSRPTRAPRTPDRGPDEDDWMKKIWRW